MSKPSSRSNNSTNPNNNNNNNNSQENQDNYNDFHEHNFQTNSILPADSHITPPPLYKKHLQPSSPPPSATRKQLSLFGRVLSRRRKQFHCFSLNVHKLLYDSLTNTVAETSNETSTSTLSSASREASKENINTDLTTHSASTSASAHSSNSNLSSNKPITSAEIHTLFTRLPSKKPSNTDQYISLVEYLLIDNFHSSCDNRLTTQTRTDCLSKIKYLFLAVDTAFVEHQKEEEEEKKRLLKRARDAREKLLKTRNSKGRMGSLMSRNSGGSRKPADNEIIVLDDSPPPSPIRKTNANANANESTSKSNNATNANANTNVPLPQNPSAGAAALASNKKKTQGTSLNSESLATTTMAAVSAATIANRNTNTNTTTNTTANATENTQTSTSTNKSTSASASASKPVASTSSSSSSTFQFVPSNKIPPSQNYIPNYTITQAPYLAQQANTQKHRPAPLTFLPDQKTVPNNPNSHTTSYSLTHRSRCEIVINTAFISCKETVTQLSKMSIPPPIHPNTNVISSVYLDGGQLTAFEKRLNKWDPYWKVLCDCSRFSNSTLSQSHPQNASHLNEIGYKTTNIINMRFDRTMEQSRDMPRTACHIPIQLGNMFKMKSSSSNSNGDSSSTKKLYEEIKWGQSSRQKNQPSNHNIQYSNHEKRMIIRALPIIPNPKYKKIRSDTHQWPKGTFLQLDSQVLFPVYQRKQQQHDPNLWKGLSYAYDITEHLNLDTMMYNQEKKVPTSLSFCTKDTEMYAIQVAVCEYISPDSLLDICMSSGTKGSIAKMDYNDGLSRAMKHFEKETLVLDSDDEDGSGNNSNSKKNTPTASGIKNLTCSLICPVSMQKIDTPVRGRNCKHLNCFDLRTYLHSNSKVSGGRWRCFVCEDFIAVDDLVYDGFIAQVLETHGKDVNTATRDKMQLSNDGTWKLLDEASSSMKRNQKKRKMKECDRDSKRPNIGSGKTGGAEVIDIID